MAVAERNERIAVTDADPGSDDARLLLAELGATLARLTGADGAANFSAADVVQARSAFLLARAADDGAPLGCGSLRRLHDDVAEVKRMFARPGTRGVGRALLVELERRAAGFGYREIWLETRKINTRAVDFYRHAGYAVRPNYGVYVGRDEAICFAKSLPRG